MREREARRARRAPPGSWQSCSRPRTSARARKQPVRRRAARSPSSSVSADRSESTAPEFRQQRRSRHPGSETNPSPSHPHSNHLWGLYPDGPIRPARSIRLPPPSVNARGGKELSGPKCPVYTLGQRFMHGVAYRCKRRRGAGSHEGRGNVRHPQRDACASGTGAGEDSSRRSAAALVSAQPREHRRPICVAPQSSVAAATSEAPLAPRRGGRGDTGGTRNWSCRKAPRIESAWRARSAQERRELDLGVPGVSRRYPA